MTDTLAGLLVYGTLEVPRLSARPRRFNAWARERRYQKPSASAPPTVQRPEAHCIKRSRSTIKSGRISAPSRRELGGITNARFSILSPGVKNWITRPATNTAHKTAAKATDLPRTEGARVGTWDLSFMGNPHSGEEIEALRNSEQGQQSPKQQDYLRRPTPCQCANGCSHKEGRAGEGGASEGLARCCSGTDEATPNAFAPLRKRGVTRGQTRRHEYPVSLCNWHPRRLTAILVRPFSTLSLRPVSFLPLSQHLQ
jgi:hypothetical protein